MASWITQRSGSWSRASNNADSPWYDNGAQTALASVPADGDTVTIAAAHDILMDADQSAWTTGINGLTITSHATTPGMLYFKNGTDGYLAIKSGTTISGTNAATRGRILANSDGVWANSTALQFSNKAVISLLGTTTPAKIDATYLDIKLYCTQPTNPYVETYANAYTCADQTTGVNTTTGVITFGSAVPADGTIIRLKSSGTLPTGFYDDVAYVVRAGSGSTCKIAYHANDVGIIVPTATGSGTLTMYTGHTNTSTDTMNVVQDVRADTPWVTTDGHDWVALVDYTAVATVDMQRLQLTTINAGTIQFSANIDSAQYPLAKVYLIARNVSIRCSGTHASQAMIDYGTATHTGHVYQCEFRMTAGTGTTMYGAATSAGTGHTFSGTLMGCYTGITGANSWTVSGIVGPCYNGVNLSSFCTFSGTVAGCTNVGVNACWSSTVSGIVEGCAYGVVSNYTQTLLTVTGTLRGNGYGIINTTLVTVSTTGRIVNGQYGVQGCNFTFLQGKCLGVAYGIGQAGSLEFSGLIEGSGDAVFGGTILVRGGVFKKNVRDLSGNTLTYNYRGYAPWFSASSRVAYYLHASWAGSYPAAALFYDPCNAAGVSQRGYLECYSAGGYTKTAAYAVGTHGTPPTAIPYVHESWFQDNDREMWLEIPIFGYQQIPIALTIYHKATTTSDWTTAPLVEICDPNVGYKMAGEQLATSGFLSIADTNWHTTVVTYTPTHDRQLTIRFRGQGGNAGGTGTGGMYWFCAMPPDYPVNGNVRSGIAYAHAAYTGTLVVPAVSDVRNAVQFGAGGTEYTGTVTLPTAGQVLVGVGYGAGGTQYTGTFDEAARNTDPAEANVLVGVGYKIANVAKTGTFDLPSYTLISGVVAAEWVVSGHDTYTGGSAGTYPTTATTQAAQLAADKAAIEAAKSTVLSTSTILTVTGTYHAPDAAEVISTAVFGALSATAGTYDVSDVESGNIKLGASIGGVDGVYGGVSLDAVETAIASALTGYVDEIVAATGGTGARTVTVTVNDGSAVLEGASVRLVKGAETYLQTTDVNGQCVFNVDDGTWAVAITSAGCSFSGATIAVDGDEAATFSMTPYSIAAPAAPNLTTGYVLCLGIDGLPEAGVTINAQMTSGPGSSGYALDTDTITMTSDDDGLAQYSGFVRGAAYKFRRGNSTWWTSPQVAPSTPMWSLIEILGAP